MKSFKSILFRVLLLSLLIFSITYLLFSFFFFSINKQFLYLLKNTLSIDNPISNDLVLVTIDEKTLDNLGYPIDRKDYINFLENLGQAGPAAIGIDILFLNRSQELATDIALSKVLSNLGNVIIGGDISVNNEFIEPYIHFKNTAKYVGYFQPFVNPRTNQATSIEPYRYLNYNGETKKIESFSFLALRQYYNYLYNRENININDIYSNTYNFFNIDIPISKSRIIGGRDINEFNISYTSSDNFNTVSFYDIYNGNFNKSFLKDKIVLVGFTSEGVFDDFTVPGYGIIKGVYIHLNAINNILTNNFLIYFNKNLEYLIVFIFIFITIFTTFYYLKFIKFRKIFFIGILFFILIFISYILLFIFVFKYFNIYLIPNNPFEFLVALFLSFIASLFLKYLEGDKNKKQLLSALGEYVSKDIANSILYGDGEVKLSGENKEITIFFSDIEGFTTISEKLSPEDLVSFLREYLGDMSEIIMDNKGFINKYEGDAIMALWGVFGEVRNYGVHESCTACLLQKSRLKLLNESFIKKGFSEIKVRMGLHTGEAVIGNIGAKGRKMEFTALGDNVNLASRLEGVNKFYNTSICVSENVYNLGKDDFTFRYLDTITVKGKTNAVKIYELIGFKLDKNDYVTNLLSDYNKALNYYQNKNFSEALEIFSKLSQLKDGPSIVYKKRCEDFLLNPPDEDWNFITNLEQK